MLWYFVIPSMIFILQKYKEQTAPSVVVYTLKALREGLRNMSVPFEICFKIKEILDFDVPWNVQPISTCFVNSITIKTTLPCVYSQTCFYCHGGILKDKNTLPNCQSFSPKPVKFLQHGFTSFCVKRKILKCIYFADFLIGIFFL